mmetsp:Transcript_26046/g.39074  ORF Transcript_26046/g.39074 Transcript_26046/m.39074 type:complete len:130 (-) Transcript_26046:2-391(-)
MRLERDDMKPVEITDIWERVWGVQYASRIRFESPDDSDTKFLSPQDDVVPLSPAIVRLDVAKTSISILYSLTTALKQFGRMSRDEVVVEKERRRQQQEAEAERRNKADAKEVARYKHLEVRQAYDARPR